MAVVIEMAAGRLALLQRIPWALSCASEIQVQASLKDGSEDVGHVLGKSEVLTADLSFHTPLLSISLREYA